MTPKEKARELIDKMDVIHYMKLGGKNSNSKGLPISMHDSQVKQCALIAVDEILENVNYFFTELEKDGLPNKFDDEIEYWNEVKQEINNL